MNTSSALTLLRLTFGTVLLAHGWLKLSVFTITGTVQFFGSLGLPPIIAYLVIFGEIAGGLALLFGLFTRLVAWLSLPIMLGSLWVHLGNGWLFSNANGGWEFPAVLVMLSIVIGLAGPGAFALDQSAWVRGLFAKDSVVHTGDSGLSNA